MKELCSWSEPSWRTTKSIKVMRFFKVKSNNKYKPQGTSGPNDGVIGITRAMGARQMV